MYSLEIFRRGMGVARNRDGIAAIEFAMVAPLLIVLVMGTARIGYAYGVQNALSQLASDAARLALPERDRSRRAALVETYVSSSAASYPFLEKTRVQCTTKEQDARMTVSVSMDVSQIPSIPLLDSVFPLPSTQTASAVIGVQP